MKYLSGVVAILATVMVSAAPMPAHAWGREGHEIIAAIALAHLSPATRAEVERLFAATEPGTTLISAAPWADEIKDRTTAHWHFMNYPSGDCQFRPPVECRDSDCLVAAVDREENILANRSLPDSQRVVALKFLDHLVGDANQPLHAYAPGRGANEYQVRLDGRGTNLHAVWDSGLIRDDARRAHPEERGESMVDTLMQKLSSDASASRPDYPALTQRLIAESFELQGRVQLTPNPVYWSELACKTTTQPTFFPGVGASIGEGYENTWEPIMELHLVIAGLQLANVLNVALGQSR